MKEPLAQRVSRSVRTVPGFPKPGIQFKDITPLLANPDLMGETVAAMLQPFQTGDISHVVGVESRGFLFGMPIALALRAAFVPARKPGKLPGPTIRESFNLEYGQDALEIHADALGLQANVLVVDDVLATGGTVAAVCRLVESAGGTVSGIAVLGVIAGLAHPDILRGKTVHSLLSF